MNTIFNKPITEIITLRHSVRNYETSPLSKDTIEKIEKYIDTVENPFNKNVRIKLIEKGNSNNKSKLGTYGVIKGAKYFLLAACEDNEIALMALGYTLEKIVLYCTSLGLGTVWLGGTFNKGGFAKAMNLNEKEILPIVCPVGYEGGKKSLVATLFGGNTNKRKNYSEIFFNENFNTSLEPSDSYKYNEPLKMLRLAPSAVNKQPWRALKDNNNLHFYLANYKELNKVDLGIALCHFHLTAIEKGLNGNFISLDSIKNRQDINFTYVISWIDK